MARMLVNYLKAAGVNCSIPSNPAVFADANQMSREEQEAIFAHVKDLDMINDIRDIAAML